MMKKLSGRAVVFFVYLVSSHLNAQNIDFGVKGGVNVSTLNVSGLPGSYSSKAGYHAGFFVRGKFDKVALQPEVILFKQGAKIDYGFQGKVDDNFTYLCIPVMMKVYLVKRFNIQVGPQFGFLLDAERKLTDPGQLGNNPFKADMKGFYKSKDISLSLGAGYDFPLGLELDVRYNIGLQNLSAFDPHAKQTSRLLMVSLGWNFLK